MLRLLHSTPPLRPPSSSSSSSLTRNRTSTFSCKFKIFGINYEALELNYNSRGYINHNRSLCIVNAVEQDSEYEVDPEKAREALRKLDEQLLSLSRKQVKAPKIRAVDIKQGSSQLKDETSGLSGSFLAYLATVLLIFTIFYNILFLTVIKPSIDGEESVSVSSLFKDFQEGASPQQSSTSPEVQDVP